MMRLNGIWQAFVVCILSMLLCASYALAQQSKKMPAVPVLCYHQVREHHAGDNDFTKAITVTPGRFANQMQTLADSGFHAILPGQLYLYLSQGKPLPTKPVLITFDDNTISQYTHALPVLNKFGFKAVFFVMTVSVGKTGYMSKEQLKQLQLGGHVLGGHGWDHKNVRDYGADDWKQQMDKPMQWLSSISGSPVEYFAFPYGSYTDAALEALRQRKIKLAFVLDNQPSPAFPMLTVRRLMVTNQLSGPQLIRQMRKMFK